LTQQMRQTGNSQLADMLEKSQKDAKALTAAHDAVSGKFGASVYRLMQQHPTSAWPGLIAMGALHGITPWPIPQLGGIGVGAWNVRRVGLNAAQEVGQRLQSEMPPESFQTTTQTPDTDFSGGKLADKANAIKSAKQERVAR
jgi:hypothetical protein